MKLNSASFGVEVRDVHVRLMLGENLRTVPTGRVEKETVSTVHTAWPAGDAPLEGKFEF